MGLVHLGWALRSRLHAVRVLGRVGTLALAMLAMMAAFFVPGAQAAPTKNQIPDPESIEVLGSAPAFYYKPASRKALPVLMFLHGRGGNPEADCKKWARVARNYGWLVCPSGPEDRGGGARGWANNAELASRIMDNVVEALHAKYKSRVRTRGNILIGFSEGAFVAQQVGLKYPKKWNRWMILAASDKYWLGGDPKKELAEARKDLRRVYLVTGETDGVVESTKATGDMLKKAKIKVKVKIVAGMGHEIPADKMVANYKNPLAWLAAAN